VTVDVPANALVNLFVTGEMKTECVGTCPFFLVEVVNNDGGCAPQPYTTGCASRIFVDTTDEAKDEYVLMYKADLGGAPKTFAPEAGVHTYSFNSSFASIPLHFGVRSLRLSVEVEPVSADLPRRT
jgi:hypothetical protein